MFQPDHQENRTAGASLTGGSRARFCEAGGMMFYIFLAVGLLGALTYFFTRDSQGNLSVQISNKVAQELYVQSNLIRSAIVECTLAHPEGGGDIAPIGAPDGTIDADDNPNTPYPLTPSNAINNSLVPVTTFANDLTGNAARNVACLIGTTTPTTKQLVFQGSGSQGRYLPPPPNGWSEWQYTNDADDGVYISIIPDSGGIAAADLLATKFNIPLCQAEWFGSGTFKVWIQKASCP